VVGIVERDANIQEAAKVLVHARFVVNGKSQYAPDIILVNEWVKDEFCKAILEHSALRFAEEGNAVLDQKSSQPLWFKNLLKDGNATMLSSDSRYTIIDVKSR
jgi:acyl-CoA reductase-like NAD-dependent aldehyde dehydrogenase